jgi:hypothetical protein
MAGERGGGGGGPTFVIGSCYGTRCSSYAALLQGWAGWCTATVEWGPRPQNTTTPHDDPDIDCVSHYGLQIPGSQGGAGPSVCAGGAFGHFAASASARIKLRWRWLGGFPHSRHGSRSPGKSKGPQRPRRPNGGGFATTKHSLIKPYPQLTPTQSVPGADEQ